MRLRRLLFILATALVLTATVAFLMWQFAGESQMPPQAAPQSDDPQEELRSVSGNEVKVQADHLLHEATREFKQKNFAEAETLARRVSSSSPHYAAALRLAGESCIYQKKYDAALDYFHQITDQSSSHFLDGNVLAGQILVYRKYRMSDGEALFRRVLAIDPDHAPGNFSLYNLLSACGRRREMIPYLLKTIKLGQFAPEYLYALSGESSSYVPPPLVEQCYEVDKECLGALFGNAQGAINRGNLARAKELLQIALGIDSEFIPAQAQMGIILAREDAEEPFLQWHNRLPSTADQDPDIWAIRGEWAQRCDQPEVAIRCYWQAVRGDPNLRGATVQLSKLLSAIGNSQDAQTFLQRSQQLQLLKQLEARVTDEGRSEALIRQIVDQLELLGRLWEAWGWCRVVVEHDAQNAWADSRARELWARLQDDPPQTLPAANPGLQIDLSHFPLPTWRSPSATSPQQAARSSNAVAFEEIGPGSGFNFAYFSSPSRPEDGRKMYELTGGGVAVLDYDADGWPDLYLTQGCPWPPTTTDTSFTDRLFRNLGDGTLVDVTATTGILEADFSQGAAVGDFDADGFDDILVGNIGKSSLFRNNGDGTFTDVTASAGLKDDEWTTSCLIADINGDALPDLYCVNYLEGDDIFQRVCSSTVLGTGSDKKPRMCKPTVFEAEQDSLYLNVGDGSFKDVSSESGIHVEGGKGLGIVAADFDGSGRLSLFVANDTRANFLFHNQTPPGSARPVLIEQGIERGVAFDGAGVATGSMGIAIGDCNHDQQLDLFVTNFFSESNTLYLSSKYGFKDETQRHGLRTPSLPMVGFGTQFMDGDLDGDLDLVVANGHIDDLREHGILFQMPPHYFDNDGTGRFELVSADVLGSYFRGRYLGRGLASLDWNRDGRPDVVISHIDRPAALLQNTTKTLNHYVSLKLRGTQSSRDAIGTIVTVIIGEAVRVLQLTAGDGYQASNERKLHFGIGAASRIDRLTIHFPSGIEHAFSDVAGDRELLVIEGTSKLIELP